MKKTQMRKMIVELLFEIKDLQEGHKTRQIADYEEIKWLRDEVECLRKECEDKAQQIDGLNRQLYQTPPEPVSLPSDKEALSILRAKLASAPASQS